MYIITGFEQIVKNYFSLGIKKPNAMAGFKKIEVVWFALRL